ncbi:hypothetical protein, partial [Faecalispora sporosphaeroides]
NGRMAATTLFPLATSIPTAVFMKDLLMIALYSVSPFFHCRFNLLGYANTPIIGRDDLLQSNGCQ